jgi:hypothetical protein
VRVGLIFARAAVGRRWLYCSFVAGLLQLCCAFVAALPMLFGGFAGSRRGSPLVCCSLAARVLLVCCLFAVPRSRSRVPRQQPRGPL